MNLLEETEDELELAGKKWDDVVFITDGEYEIGTENFKDIARKTDYNEGYGHVYIPLGLKIVGGDWWLERYEYDGSECWTYKTRPDRPGEKRILTGFTDKNYSEACVFENA